MSGASQFIDLSFFTECDVIQCSSHEEWLANRKIGASDSAGILGEGYAGQSLFSIWAEKAMGVGNEFDGDEDYLMCGKELEPGLRRIFTRKTGLECIAPPENHVLVSRRWEFMTATLDAIVIHPDFGPIPGELKNRGEYTLAEWDANGPLKAQIQCQHQCAVTGAPAAYLFGLIGGNKPKPILVERNESFIGALVDTLREFWELVQSKTPPEVDGSEATAKALKRLHPADSGAVVMLPPEAIDWDRELSDVKDALKHYTERERLLKNRFAATIGDATFGCLPDGSQYSYKTQTRPEKLHKASTYRVLRKVKATK